MFRKKRMMTKQTKLSDWDGKQKNLKHFEERDQYDPDDEDCSYEAVYRSMGIE